MDEKATERVNLGSLISFAVLSKKDVAGRTWNMKLDPPGSGCLQAKPRFSLCEIEK